MTTLLTLLALLIVVPLNLLNMLVVGILIKGRDSKQFEIPPTERSERWSKIYLLIEAVAILVLVFLSSMPLALAFLVGLAVWATEFYSFTRPSVVGKTRPVAAMKQSGMFNIVTIVCAIVLAF